jgi:purine-cytosine permease-like protein
MKKNPITDINQNFWQLASIQCILGIPEMLLGFHLANEYGAYVAIPSIFIGNLLLWIIGLGIISMTFKDRQNAMENVKTYLGRSGGMIASLILVLAFAAWYVAQIHATTSAINETFNTQNHLNIKIVGIILGVVVSLLSIGGIKIIKRICLISFPILVTFILYKIFNSNYSLSSEETWGLSFFAIITTASVNLPCIINLPTFFRHAHSKADAFLALTLMTVFFSFFEMSSIFLGFSNPQDFLASKMQFLINPENVISLICILLSFICINLVNIYFASAGWEMILPHKRSSKEYAIVGLLGTAAYALSPSLEFLGTITNISIWTLGYVLLITFLTGMVIKHRSSLEKGASNLCWYLGAVIGFIFFIKGSVDANQALIAAICTSTILFLIFAFARETIWSINKIKTSQF